MATLYEQIQIDLKAQPKTWLISGVAGFIGSNLLEKLLKLGQTVVGLDNFSTGHQHNLDEVRELVGEEQWQGFSFIEGDICDLDTCRLAVRGTDYILHQAALGSVPRSIENPIATNQVNINGFLNMLIAAKDERVASFIYAASSSTYGDHPGMPKVEDKIGNPLSPYAVTKYVNELYASVFFRNYNYKSVGLRYFNVFGPRQDPNGAYAAVIPKWTAAMIQGDDVIINGDGETSRDFCYINNVVQANILAAVVEAEPKDEIYNVACNAQTTLNQLYKIIELELKKCGINYNGKAIYKDFREGDVRHSRANIDKAKKQLGYQPFYTIRSGLSEAMPWYVLSLSSGIDGDIN